MNRNRMWALIFFLAGAALVFYGVGLVRDARACANWPTVQGRVLSAEAQVVSRQKDKSTYAPNVSYRYEVDSKDYESSRLTIVPRNYSSRQSVNEILTGYPVGGTVLVHYDPKNPANCMLDTSTTGSEWAYPIGGALMIGVGFLFLKG